MLLWIILGVLVLIVVLIMLTKIGLDVRYEDDIFRVSLAVAWMRLQLIPKSKRKDREKKEEKEKEPESEKKSKEEKKKREKKEFSLPFNFEEIIEILEVLFKGLVDFNQKVALDRFVLHWICPGSWDPYWMSRLFGVVNAGLSQLAPVWRNRFHCRDSSVWTDIDYVRDDMKLEFCMIMTIRIGQIVVSSPPTALAIYKIYQRSRRRVKQEAEEERQALEKWMKEHPEDRALAEAS